MINQDPIAQHMQIDNALYPTTNVAQPTDECRKLSKEAVNYLLNRYTILPNEVSATIEEGIYLAYTNGTRKMILEVYNNLTIAGLVADTDKQEILISEDIGTMSSIHELVSELLED